MRVSGRFFGAVLVSIAAATSRGAAMPDDLTASESVLRNGNSLSAPLAPVGRAELRETGDLAAALAEFRRGGDPENPSALIDFVKAHPSGAWTPSLRAGLGRLYRDTGHVGRALAELESAWSSLAGETSAKLRPIADAALGNLLELDASLGRIDDVRRLLAQADGRAIAGNAAEQVAGARRGLWMMVNDPGGSFRCGPLAVEQVARAIRPEKAVDPRISAYRSSPHGTTLSEIARLASESGLDLVPVRRSAGDAIPVPAVVHWKADHFAAAVQEREGRYLVRDFTFGEDRWVDRSVIEEEASGYLLVPRAVAAGFRSVSASEGETIHGQGATGNPNPGATTPNGPFKPGGCNKGNGMPFYDFHVAIVSLHVTDTPVGYEPPKGPAMSFGITYNSREAFQPASFSFSNLGPRWEFNWLSYVDESNPAHPEQPARVAELGGGSVTYNAQAFPPDGSIVFAPNPEGAHETLVRVRVGVDVQFRRDFPDGSRAIYSVADGATTHRKYFLTSLADASGNTVTLTYNTSSSFVRLASISDALGQATTVQYGGSDPNRITGVMDPFGRTASFAYDGNGMLASVTDAIHMTSTFAYGPNAASPSAPPDFMNAMTTPYGTTTFAMWEDTVQQDGGFTRWLVATNPLGQSERVEFRHSAPGIAATTMEPMPPGFTNNFLQYRNSFYWDQKAMQSYDSADPDRYNKATYVFHWLHHREGNEILASSIPEAIQPQGMRRTWFAYAGQPSSYFEGYLSAPLAVARVLDDGTLQATSFDRDASGRILNSVDPAGREFVLDYDPARAADILGVRRFFDNGTSETLASFGYNGQHRPTTYTNAAGKTFTLTYNAAGQLTSITRPDNVVTILTYDGQGYLRTVTRPGTAYQESFTYDAFGRPRTWTATDGYSLIYDYDDLDRVTGITFPDGSAEKYGYDRLDLVSQADRLGRTTSYDVDAGGNVVAETAPDGKVTRYEWCGCGSLEAMIDPRGNRTEWLLDALGRAEEKRVNARTIWRLSYDSAGRVVQMTDARNQSILYEYNPDDTMAAIRHVGTTSPTPDVTIAWDRAYRRRLSVSDGTGTTRYDYVPIGATGGGRVAKITYPSPAHVLTFGYDVLGRRTSRTLDGTTMSLAFDTLDRPWQVTSPLGVATSTFEGSTQRVASSQIPGRMSWSLGHGLLSEDFALSSETNTALSTNALLSKFAFTRDGTHDQITAITQTDTANPTGKFFQMSYDPVGELVGRPQTASASPGSAIVHEAVFGYDDAGNRTSEQIDASVTTATFDGENRLTTIHRGLSQSAVAAMRAAREMARKKYLKKHPPIETKSGGDR